MEAITKYKFSEKDKKQFLNVFKNYRNIAHKLNISLSYTYDILNGNCYVSCDRLNYMYKVLKEEMEGRLDGNNKPKN